MGDVDVGNLLIQLKADVDGLRASLEQSKETVQQGTDNMADAVSENMQKIGQMIVAAFAVDKIKDFSVSAVEEFAKVQRSLEFLSIQVDKNAGNWAAHKDRVDAFITSAQILSGATKDQLVEALTKAEIKTHDLGDAMSIVDTANKMAAMGMGDVTSNVKILGQAYEGNTTGLARFGKQLNLSDEDMKDSTKVWKAVNDVVRDTNKVMDDTQAQLNAMGMAWEKTKESFGKFVAVWTPLVRFFENLFSTALQSFILMSKQMDDVMSGNWKKLIADGKEVQKETIDIWTDAGQALTDADHKRTDDHQKENAKRKKAAADTAQYLVDREKAGIEQEKEQDKEYKKFKEELDKGRLEAGKKQEEEFTKFTKEKAREREREDKKSAQETSHYIESATKETVSSMIAQYKAGTLSVASAFADLGKSIAKALVNAVGQGLIQSGTADLLTGFADMTNPLLAAAAPGFFASGGLKVAGGSSIVAVADAFMASGGYVDVPTLAVLGEDGPEKVTPLSAGHPMDQGGGGDTHHHWNFPGVTDRHEAAAAGQSAGLAFIKTQQAAKTRAGYRNTSF